MHLTPDPSVKPDLNAPLTRAEIDRVLMHDTPTPYQAPPFGSAQPMKRTSDTDPDGDVFGNPADTAQAGEPVNVEPGVVADPAALELPAYQPTPEEQAEAAMDSSAQ